MIGAVVGASQQDVEQLLAQFRAKRVRRLRPRELGSELLAAAAFVAAAGALALWAPWQPALSWPVGLLLVGTYALASRVRFEVWSCHTDATQLALIPALVLLPPATVPLVAALGYLGGELPDYLARRKHPERLVVAVANSWYAIGPATVLAIAGPIDSLGDWHVLVAALGAQLLFDSAINAPREWLELGASPRAQLPGTAWTYGVDSLLSSIGFIAALASLQDDLAFLLVLPLIALLAIFARERQGRLDNVLALSEAYRGTTMLLAELVETDNEYTGLHSQSVVDLSLRVAEALGLSSGRRRTLEFGALLHDVGKMRVPKEIINKPGPLEQAEWELVKRHTLDGQRMLDRVGGALGEAGQIVRSSHERWDGTGYPDGLVGDAIPVEARIVSCCDAFNAMTTDRCYRPALPAEQALQELTANAGTQFDPDVAEAVIQIVRDGSRTRV